MKIGMLVDRVAAEEKLLLKEFEVRNVDLEMIDVRKMLFRLDDPTPWKKYDVIFDRSVSFSKALATLQVFKGWNIPTVNFADVAEVCGSKLTTSIELERNGIPTPKVAVAYSAESALQAIEELGYPVVMKLQSVLGGVCLARSTIGMQPKPFLNTRLRSETTRIPCFIFNNLSKRPKARMFAALLLMEKQFVRLKDRANIGLPILHVEQPPQIAR